MDMGNVKCCACDKVGLYQGIIILQLQSEFVNTAL